MIVKIDHLAVCVHNFHESINQFSSLGYKLNFIDSGIPNPKIKQDLMQGFPPLHSIAVLSSPGNVNVELIDHGSLTNRQGYIIPVLSGLLAGIRNEKEPIDEKDFFKGVFDFEDLIYYSVSEQEVNSISVKGAYIKTRCLCESEKFWSLLGFRRISAQKDFIILEFESLIEKSKLQLFLQEDKLDDCERRLDDFGFNCLALVSNFPAREKALFEQDKNIYNTNIENICINKQELSVFFIKGPSNELVEIIGPARNTMAGKLQPDVLKK